WDFDKTLSPHYMQRPVFEAYGIDAQRFWREVHALPSFYARAGVTVNRDTCYLGHLLSYVKAGYMPDLSNSRLRALGSAIEFYPGIPELMQRTRVVVSEGPFREGDLRVEHYVVSTGLAELIRGSAVAEHIDGVWASEFIECPAGPGAAFDAAPESGPISQIAGFLDNTTKTRALFEINKGVNKLDSITVNDAIPEEERRVPFRSMIYIADGPSDIPCFSVVRRSGGRTLAVYDPHSDEQFAQVSALHEAGRVDMIGPADYREGTQTDMWLRLQVRKLAERILEGRRGALARRVAPSPVHLDADEC
ncbi:MAG TPA: haloacid dehalogenase-like hydrolase, partial [Candidatus Hydrogenedentes bacterium]|nr:haloacid dehalogenase-like hydrolase [Candidatus Hydrogenedentota bacterium]